jgi:hypothetical protein
MDNPKPIFSEGEPETESHPGAEPESLPEYPPSTEAEPGSYVNERIRHAYDRAKTGFGQAKDYYQRSPKLQKVTYQGRFLPAFWTVACIFSLLVNVILIATLVSIGHHFFEIKALVADGLVSGLSENLALMDKAHIVTTVPVETTVKLQDNFPVVFDLPIKENTRVVLAEDTDIDGTTLINLAPVPLSITLPAGTPIQVDFDMTIPVSQTVPVNFDVPVSLLVPLDLAVSQTDLHQSIVGLQSAIEPYKGLMESSFNSPEDISLCNDWWSGWLCSIFFGKQ